MNNNSVVFFSHNITHRLRYVAELVFQDLLGLTIAFTQNENKYNHSPLPKIVYSHTPLSNFEKKGQKEMCFIQNQTLLFENEILRQHIDADFSYFLNASPFDFDVLAAIFLLVTRYEEYVVDASLFDKHNRFSAQHSLAHKFNFLQKPLVNQWVMEINKRLNQLFPGLKTTLPYYRFQPTFDIDMPWKYKNKGFLRTVGGLVMDVIKLNIEVLKNKVKILRGVKNDPDFTFDYIFEIHKLYNVQPIFFLLLGNHGEFDKNPHESNKAFRQLIEFISTHYNVGLHPSYRSNSDFHILKKEKERFERMTHLPLVRSRQHFLKLRFPETYHNLLSLGVKQDFSMGYADNIGFRASIATPFRWFDLTKNEVTQLWIYPFQVMDVTLRDYLKLTPEEAMERMDILIKETQAVGGTFISLWHNSSFSNTEGWENWRGVYEKMIKKIALNYI